VGATGAVGRTMLAVLEERGFPVAALHALTSHRSAGRTVRFAGTDVATVDLAAFDFGGVDIALFSAGGQVSLEHAPRAVAAGAVVIDNTNAFRMEPDVPLVVPEINPGAIAKRPRGIIANPNCSTIQMVVALWPLHRRSRIRRVVVSTYQSVSGAGSRAVEELRAATWALLAGERPPAGPIFPHVIGFNCLPQIDVFLEDGYTREEHKMLHETRKIFGDPDIGVSATCVRVPVPFGHAEAVNVEFESPLSPEEARGILSRAPGVEIVDDPARRRYPLQSDCAGRDPVLVGRIRQDPSCPRCLDLWIVADNLRKGAATNAVQIAEIVARD
jgi:aspartate-semialdehyde dehydrogenase